MANQAGKGDSLRKGANLPAFWAGHDRIFRKRKSLKEWRGHFGHADEGGGEYNIDDQLTEQEYFSTLKA